MSSEASTAAASQATKRPRLSASAAQRAKKYVDADVFHLALYRCTHVSRCILFRLTPEEIVAMIFLTRGALSETLKQTATLRELLATFFPYAAVPPVPRHALAVLCKLTRRQPASFDTHLLVNARQRGVLLARERVVVSERWPTPDARRVYEVSPAYRERLTKEDADIEARRAVIDERLAEVEGDLGILKVRLQAAEFKRVEQLQPVEEAGYDAEERAMRSDTIAKHRAHDNLNAELRELERVERLRHSRRADLSHTLWLGEGAWIDSLTLVTRDGVRFSAMHATALDVWRGPSELGTLRDDWVTFEPTLADTEGLQAMRGRPARTSIHMGRPRLQPPLGTIGPMAFLELRPVYFGAERQFRLLGFTAPPPPLASDTPGRLREQFCYRLEQRVGDGADVWRVLRSPLPTNVQTLSFDEPTRTLYLVQPQAVIEVDMSNTDDVVCTQRAFSIDRYVVGLDAVVNGPLMVDVSQQKLTRDGVTQRHNHVTVIETVDFRNIDAAGRVVVHRYRSRAVVGGDATPRALTTRPGNLLLEYTDIGGYHYPQFLAKPMPWTAPQAAEFFHRYR